MTLDYFPLDLLLGTQKFSLRMAGNCAVPDGVQHLSSKCPVCGQLMGNTWILDSSRSEWYVQRLPRF